MLRKLRAALGLALTLLAGGQAMAIPPGQIALLSPPVYAPAGQMEEFDGAAGTVLHQKTYLNGVWTIIQPQVTTNTNTCAFKVDGSGHVSGNQCSTGGAAASTFITTPYPASDSVWITWQSTRTATTPFVQNTVLLNPRYVGDGTTNVWDHHNLQFTGTATTIGALNFRKNLGTVPNDANGSNILQAQNVQVLGGDNLSLRQTKSGAVIHWDLYQNNVKVKSGSAVDIASQGITINNLIGFNGVLGTAQFDYIEIGDPTQQAMLALKDGGRINQRAADGSVVVKLRAEWTKSAPKQAYYTVYDASNDTPVSGQANQAWVNLHVEGQYIVGQTKTITSPPSSYYVKVERRDIAGGIGKAISTGPPRKAGECLMSDGQSLNQQQDDANSGGTVSQPTDGWISSARNDGTYSTEDTQRTIRAIANSPLAGRQATFQTAMGATIPTCQFMGGKGGTRYAERIPGDASGIFQAKLDAIDRTGGDFSIVVDIGGTFDAPNLSDRTAIPTNIDLIRTALEAKLGHSLRVMINPVGAVRDGTSDANVEYVRRIQTKMTVDDPTHYSLGPQSSDLQHLANDQYHLAASAYFEHSRRIGFNWAYMLGASVSPHAGPYAVSISLPSDHEMAVTYNLEGADGFTIRNGATAGYLGGQGFNSGTTCSSVRTAISPLTPTGVSYGTPSGGQIVVTYTFGGTPFSGGHGVWRGPYGFNPFNPGQNNAETTINGNMAANASVAEATRVNGEPNLPLRPYYNWAGPADGSQDCLTV